MEPSRTILAGQRGSPWAAVALVATLAWAASCFGPAKSVGPGRETPATQLPRLHPALHGTTIPPNLCPVTFEVDEPGTRYYLRVETGRGRVYESASRDPRLRLPLRPWKALLQEAAGSDLALRISVRGADGTRRAFAPVVVHVSTDRVDPYLAYRRIRPLYNFWRDVGIYQRELEGWGEKVVVHGRDFTRGCTNCHAFTRADPATMTVGIRSQEHGSATLLCQDGAVTKLNAKWGYTSWHPSGKVAAYSLNDVNQFFHCVGAEVRDVCDLDSDLVVYYPDGQRVVTSPGIAAPDYLETYPAWSADGRELYFCRAAITWEDRGRIPPPGYEHLHYSLVKVTFDLESGQFGPPQVVISGEAVGKSVMLPRPSPDGRFLLFCLCDYGCFPVFQPSSDLYLLDLATGVHRRLELNSDLSESWHSWSTNSRWFAFSSKAHDGVFTRVYLAHVDADGMVSQPIVLPQADPSYYDRCLQTFSVPEFLTAPVSVSPRALAGAVKSRRAVAVSLPPISMTAKPARPSPPSAPADAWAPAPH